MPCYATEIGVASWYGKENNRSCTGKRLQHRLPGAAHKTLPIGSRARVTNLKNRKSVVVVIEDRGPYVRNRVIDVNEAAARQLNMLKTGLVNVIVEPE